MQPLNALLSTEASWEPSSKITLLNCLQPQNASFLIVRTLFGTQKLLIYGHAQNALSSITCKRESAAKVTASNLAHPSNAEALIASAVLGMAISRTPVLARHLTEISFSPSGRTSLVKLMQFSNALSRSYVSLHPSSNVTSFSKRHSVNAWSPMNETLFGKLSISIAEQFLNASLSILFKLAPGAKTTALSSMQFSNARSPIICTFSETCTCLMLLPLNCPSSMTVCA